jgi:hypothetical protein
LESSVRSIALTVAFAVTSTALHAQNAPGTPREVEGRILRGQGSAPAPLTGAWATLHRVGKDRSGPLDSVRTDASGRFRFGYRADGDSTALYFVSTNYSGIAYFTSPLRAATVSGDEATLTVFDTTSGPLPITVRGRHIVVTEPDSAAPKERAIIEVYELSNDSSLTRVPGAAKRTVFETRLPDGALAPRGGQGDISAEAITFEGNVVRVKAPIGPGLKQFSITYTLPTSVKQFTVPVPVKVPVLEVLLEGAGGGASGGGLKPQPASSVGGRSFTRFLGDEVPADAKVVVGVPGGSSGSFNLRMALVVTVIGAAVLLGLAGGFLRRAGAAPNRESHAADDPDALAKRIAALDAAYAELVEPTADQKAAHYQTRAQLKGRLTAAIARRDGMQ